MNRIIERFKADPQPCKYGHFDCSYIKGGPCANETQCGECLVPFGWHDPNCPLAAQARDFTASAKVED